MSRRYIYLIVLILVIGAGVFYWQKMSSAGAYEIYTDQGNRVSFEKSKTWFAGSTDGYVHVSQDANDPSKSDILIKINYPESVIPALKLDAGEQVTIGSKNMHRADSQRTNGKTFTHLLWEAPDNRKIIFEISPWQKPNFDDGIKKILASFKSL